MNIDEIYEQIYKLTFKEKCTLYKRLQNQIEDKRLFKEQEFIKICLKGFSY